MTDQPQVTPRFKQATPKRAASKRLRAVSKKRRGQLLRRADVRAVVIARQHGRCAADGVVPDVPCGRLPDRHRLEVDELQGGSHRSSEWLDPDACQALCPVHHDWKTANKAAAARLGLARHGGVNP